MFTGIVEEIGRIASVVPGDGSVRLEVLAPKVAAGVKLGDSIALNGCCLTVTAIDGPRLSFDAIPESLLRTNLGELEAEGAVNLEAALRADARLDGHIVQGHVDATGVVKRIERAGNDVRFSVACDAEFADLLVEKGSVAVDGVSLTVVEVADEGFDVALIPHTLLVTTLGQRGPGSRVNLEADVLGKYVLRYLARLTSIGESDS
jgi:riboflavin synthase